MDNYLVALYETKRQAFLLGYMQHPDKFDDAHAFAVQKRMAPIFHEGIMRETYDRDPFADVYSIREEFVTEVLNYVDKQWQAEDWESLAFNNLEEKFGGYKTNRMELVYILEYSRIARRFDENLWRAIEANAPTEASPLDSSFSPQDVSFD